MPSSAWKKKVCSDRKSTRLNSSHTLISYALFCLKKTLQIRSEEHTSELQSHSHLVCRLLPQQEQLLFEVGELGGDAVDQRGPLDGCAGPQRGDLLPDEPEQAAARARARQPLTRVEQLVGAVVAAAEVVVLDCHEG